MNAIYDTILADVIDFAEATKLTVNADFLEKFADEKYHCRLAEKTVDEMLEKYVDDVQKQFKVLDIDLMDNGVQAVKIAEGEKVHDVAIELPQCCDSKMWIDEEEDPDFDENAKTKALYEFAARKVWAFALNGSEDSDVARVSLALGFQISGVREANEEETERNVVLVAQDGNDEYELYDRTSNDGVLAYTSRVELV